MTWVKICGTTNLEDALLAVEAGADALGFVFHDQSPRKVDVESAREIVAQLPGNVEKVGVFVEQNAEEIRRTVQTTGLTAVQVVDGTNSAKLFGGLDVNGRPVGDAKLIMAHCASKLVDGGVFVSESARKSLFAILIDSGSKTVPGGTGQPFDWEAAHGMVHAIGLTIPVIVAGGLNVSNVSEALRLFEPFGVDVASGVEAKPGKKDPEKVRGFVRAVRQAERRT
jgi:phosphoribosylanthranilate isomerase